MEPQTNAFLNACLPRWRQPAAIETRVQMAGSPRLFVAKPGQIDRLALEDFWERYGRGRLWLVALAGAERAGEVLATVGLGHAPTLARPAQPTATAAREVVITTVLSMHQRDVLLVVSDDLAQAVDLAKLAAFWRAKCEAAGTVLPTPPFTDPQTSSRAPLR